MKRCVALLCKQVGKIGIKVPFLDSKVECASHHPPRLINLASQSVDNDEEVSWLAVYTWYCINMCSVYALKGGPQAPVATVNAVSSYDYFYSLQDDAYEMDQSERSPNHRYVHYRETLFND